MVGTTVAHYRIISRIGAGGMGTVYLAEDTTLNRRVALKFLQAESAGSRDGAARLLREARAASALDHPHIATIYQVGDHAGQPFIAMAHYDGETLEARLARGPVSMAEVARIVAEMADALAAAHAAGIVHRDLKPSNVMLTGTGSVKVLDFGLAKVETAETITKLTGEGATLGTASYMSPEQATGEDVDARSDLWSLGVVTYEMLAAGDRSKARTRWRSSTPCRRRRLRHSDRRGQTSAASWKIVNRTMVRHRDRRTITAAEIRDLASACYAQLSSGALPPVARSRTSRRVQLAATAVALAVVASGFAWWAQRNAKVRWARQEALPEIIKAGRRGQVRRGLYTGAAKRSLYIPDDPLLAEQIRGIERRAVIDSEPAGADVFYRPVRPKQ